MKGGKYAKTLAKIQVRGILRIREIRRNVNRDLYGDVMRVPIRMSTNTADGNQQKHPLPSFATKALIYSSRNS